MVCGNLLRYWFWNHLLLRFYLILMKIQLGSSWSHPFSWKKEKDFWLGIYQKAIFDNHFAFLFLCLSSQLYPFVSNYCLLPNYFFVLLNQFDLLRMKFGMEKVHIRFYGLCFLLINLHYPFVYVSENEFTRTSIIVFILWKPMFMSFDLFVLMMILPKEWHVKLLLVLCWWYLFMSVFTIKYSL